MTYQNFSHRHAEILTFSVSNFKNYIKGVKVYIKISIYFCEIKSVFNCKTNTFVLINIFWYPITSYTFFSTSVYCRIK